MKASLKIVIPLIFFLGYLILGNLIVGDYGISWDEPLQREHALVSAQYIKEKLGLPGESFTWQKLGDYPFRYHGVLFTLPAYGFERLLGLESFHAIFLLRHRMVFLIFWTGAVAFYFIGLKRFGDWRWAMLAPVFLLVSPRIFAHSFYNPKDLVFLPLYLFATGSLVLFLERRSLWFAALHALTCALAISLRVAAVILPAMTMVFVLLELWNGRFDRKLLRRFALKLAVYLPLVAGLSVGFWPYLWDQPFVRLAEAFDVMSEYTWQGKGLVRGKFLYGTELPWYYAPYWMFITTPLFYTFLFFTGLFFILRSIITSLADEGRLYRSAAGRMDLVFLGLSLAPLLAVIVRHSVLYDGWRHLYFIYPGFLLVGIAGLQARFRQARQKERRGERTCLRPAAGALVILTLAYNLHFMIKYHPHQQVYFNALVLGDKLTRLDLDYWGNSYRPGLEWLAAYDRRDTVRVAYQSYPAEPNLKFLPDSIQQRIFLVEKPEEADYYISNYRHWEAGMEDYKNRQGPYAGEEVFRIMVEESKILGVYVMKAPEGSLRE